MKTRLKRFLVFAVPVIIAIALMSGLSAGMEDTDDVDIDEGDHGEFIGIDEGDHGEFIGIDEGDHGEFIGIDEGDHGEFIGIDGEEGTEA